MSDLVLIGPDGQEEPATMAALADYDQIIARFIHEHDIDASAAGALLQAASLLLMHKETVAVIQRRLARRNLHPLLAKALASIIWATRRENSRQERGHAQQ